MNTPSPVGPVAFTLSGSPVGWIEVAGNACALATVALAARQKAACWPVQLTGCLLLAVVFWRAGLGGNTIRQLQLAVLSGHGWWRWTRSHQASSIPARRAGWSERRSILVAGGAGGLGVGGLLELTGASAALVPDAAILAGSLTAMVAQSRAMLEFWPLWLAVNLAGVGLCWRMHLPVTAMVCGAFAVLVVFGWRNAARHSRPAPRPPQPPAARTGSAGRPGDVACMLKAAR